MQLIPHPHRPDKIRVRQSIEEVERALSAFWLALNQEYPAHACDVMDLDLLPKFAVAFEQCLRYWLTLKDVRPEPDSTRLYLFARDLHGIYERWRAEPNGWRHHWQPECED
jgi:hypothetical protein